MLNQEIKERFHKAIVNAYRQDDEFKNVLKRKGPPEINVNQIPDRGTPNDFVWNVIEWTESEGEATFKKLVKITCDSKPRNQDLQNVGKELFPELFSEVSGNTTQLSGNSNDSVTEDSSQEKLKVFLCHASADKEIVKTLHTKLTYDGFDPWHYEKNLLGGQNWKQETTKAINNSDVFIICLSASFFNELGYRYEEFKVALGIDANNHSESIYVIPVCLDKSNDFPEIINEYQKIDYSQENRNKGYTELCKSLNVKKEKLEEQKKT